ncbi:lipid A-modifier LpxR family protein [Salinisphaera sp. SWV1]|uniref:lipid A-modifier LpxR family protein n=2 Tax=unclassified Salinisphaera TaxID=2649847 RepID=UPI003F84C3DA
MSSSACCNPSRQGWQRCVASAHRRMRRTLRWLLFGLPPLLGLSPLALAQRPHGPVTWTFAFQDDKLFLSDNQYTGGGGVSMHSAVARRLSQTHGTPAFGKSLARWVLPTGPQLGYRESWTFWQVQDTPTHLGTHRLITNDFPYMGLLGWGNTFIAFNDRNLYGAELMLGLVGPLAGGKQVQTAIHSIMSTPPHGWNNQLDNEPVVNLYYTFQHKLWRTPHFDIASSLDAALGNYFTYGQTGLIARIGQLPPGFATLPDPLGRGVNYDATQTPTDRGYFYATVAVRGTGVGRSMERQGNLIRSDNAWTRQNTLHMKPFVGQLIAGVNYVRPRWGVHFDMWMTTNTVDTGNLPPASDAHNNFGAVWFDYRFN